MRIRPRSIRLVLAALFFLTFLAGTTRDAAAAVTIALEWGACGGGVGGCDFMSPSAIAVTPGQTLRLDIFMSHDLTQGLEYHTFSLNFDADLANELNLGPMAQTEWIGTDVNPGPGVYHYGPLTAGLTTHESSPVMAGRINSFESNSITLLGLLPANGSAYTVGTFTATAPARYRVGQAFFTVNGAFVDGADIFSGLFNAVIDEFGDGNFNPVAPGTIVFGTASVHTGEIPEPGTASLLGLGLVGLVMAVRRRRSWATRSASAGGKSRRQVMRKELSVALIAALLCVAGMAREAQATVTIALVWGECGGPGPPASCTATGSDTIGADGGQTLRLDIFLSHDLTQGISIYTFSLNFDTNLDNELNLGPMAQVEWAGSDVQPGPLVQNYSPLTPNPTTRESTASQAGRINSYESAGIVGVLPANGAAYTVGTNTATAPASYRVGQAFFTVNGGFPPVDGADIFSGAFNGLFDQWFDGNDDPIPTNTIVFGTATVNPAIPEPGTLTLLGLGFIGLVLASRRSRRS